MSFGENLKNVRKQRNITQEELAEMLGVSRQAISKWESDNGYPETEKLLIISKTLNISLDYLLNDTSLMEEKEKAEEKTVVYAPTGKIAITTYDNSNVAFCHSVKFSSVLFPSKNEPKYILYGVDKVTFWGEHTISLGWYATLDDIKKELAEITTAILNGESVYKLKYYAEVEERHIGFPKLKKE